MAKYKILIVEDERIIAEDLKRTLTRLGYEITGIASSSKGALEMADANIPDLAIMDIKLRGKTDGITVAKTLNTRYDIPSIYLSAYADKNILKRAKITAPYGYIMKPFDEKELHINVEIALERSRTNRLIRRTNAVLKTVRDINQLIVREQDPQVLIKEACKILTGEKVYPRSWIVLLDKDGKLTHSSQSGWGKKFQLLKTMLKDRQVPECSSKALLKDNVVYSKGTSQCDNCPFMEFQTVYDNLTIALRSHGEIYGLMSVALAETIQVGKEEEDLFKELAGDVAFAVHDIELKEAHQKSEKLYRTLSESSQDSIFIIGKDDRVEFVNTFGAAQFGKQPSDIIGKQRASLFPPEIEKKQSKDLKKIFTTGKTITTENIAQFGNRKVWLNNILIPLKDEKGKVLSVMGISRDITKRKEAEEALKESEEKYKALYDNAPLSYQSLNEDGGFIDINPTWLRLLGYKRKEVIGKWFGDFLHPDWKPHFEKNFPAFKKRGYVHDVQFKIQHKDGHYLDISFEGCIGYNADGSFKQTYCVFKDITEQKQAEEKLQSERNEFNSILEELPIGVTVLDTKDNIVYINPISIEIDGNQTNADSLTGKDVRSIHPKHTLPTIEKLLADFKSGRKTHFSREAKRGERSVEISYHAIHNADGEYKGLTRLVSDITERKQTDEALRLSEEKYRQLFRNMLNGFAYHQIVIDENGKAIDYIFMEINDAFEELTGLKRKKIIGKKVTEALPGIENDPADWIGKYGEVALAGKELRFEQYAEPLDRWYSVIAFCPKEGYFATVFEDITERKEAEKELIKLSTAVKQSLASIVITDTAGNIEFVNQKFSEVTGYTYEESMGQNPGILKSGEQSQKFYKELWNTISSGKNWRGEFHNKKKNGELYWEDALISPVIDKEGKIINYIALKEDITEQKKNEQIQKIIHNISNAAVTSDSVEGFIMLVKNQLGTIIDTNNFYVALYNDEDDSFSIPFVQDKKNTTRTVPPGKTYTHYVFNTKETLLATQTIMAKLEHSGKVEPYGPKSKIWLGVPLISKEKVLGVIAVQSYEDEKAFDESDMKVLEFISQQISLSLERKKAEEDLKKALEKAQESDRLKSAFLANMSHEIRTPMNGILGFTDLLKAPNLTGDEKDECIQIIEKSGNRMLNTINDIVDISKIEAGMVEVEKSEVSVNNILEGLYNFFVREAGEKGLELKYNPSLSDTESRIVTDQHKLEGILTNLIKNAVKFTEKGSITFGCTLKDTENEKCLEFYVTDTGIGIPADIIDAIFNRFEQADMGIARAFEGSGLGLAISKSYVEMLDGSIWVESEEGKGSTFSFTIPYSGKTVKKNGTEQKKEAQSVTSLDHLSVIIAEDDEISQLFFKTIFKNMFKKITYTTTGKETIDECRRNPDTDIILMDIQMPEMSGYDAAREIRKFNKDVIIISQTAYGFSIDRKKALEAGCDDYIAKPIKKKEMLEIINRQIEERKK